MAQRGNKYRQNFVGPKTEPRGTPQTKLANSDKIPSITLACLLIRSITVSC